MKIESNAKGTFLVFNSGFKVPYFDGKLSLHYDENPNEWCIKEGFVDCVLGRNEDGCFIRYYEEIELPSHEDMQELCDYMINEWSKFKDIFK